jgi:hypothetical protein
VKDIADKLEYQDEEVGPDENDGGANAGGKFSFGSSKIVGS